MSRSSLRLRLGLMLGLMVATFVVAHAVTQRLVVYPSFVELEAREAQADLRRCMQAIDGELDALRRFLKDWASWTPSYEFLQDQRPGYVADNLDGSTWFAEQAMDVMVFCRPDGSVHWRKTLAADRVTSEPLPPFVGETLPRDHPLLAVTDDADSVVSGVMMTGRGPMLVASRPILTTEGTGPRTGVMIVGRLLDDALAAQLSAKVGVAFALQSPADDEGAVARWRAESEPVVREDGDDTLAVLGVVDDLWGEPVALVRAKVSREITARGRSAVFYAFGSLLVAAVVLVATLLAVMGRAVVAPLTQLTEHAAAVARELDLGQRLAVRGGGEVVTLATSFNRMLDAVQARDRALQGAKDHLEQEVAARTADLATTAEDLGRSQARLRLIFDSTAEGIVTFDALGHIDSVNRAAAEMLGLEPMAAVGRHVQTLLAEGFGIEEDGKLFRVDAGETRFPLDRTTPMVMRRADGAVVPVHASVSHCDVDGRRLFIAVLRDVSAQLAAERERQELNGRLFEASRHAGMAEIATGVLHNVGNVLNSVNVATGVVLDKLRQSRLASLGRAAKLMSERRADLAQFVTADERGKHLPDFLLQLAGVLEQDHQAVLDEVIGLSRNVEHIKQIISTQQSYAKRIGAAEEVELAHLVEDAVRINAAALDRLGVRVERCFDTVGPVHTEKHKVLQVLVNFVSNARHALEKADGARVLTLTIAAAPGDADRVLVSVADNGMGIAPQNLQRIFTHGFTTRPTGHGFGLHSGVAAARSLGGALRVASEGLGRGATFTLELPRRCPEDAAATPDVAPAADGEARA